MGESGAGLRNPVGGGMSVSICGRPLASQVNRSCAWADHEVIDHDAHLGKVGEELGQQGGGGLAQVEPEHVIFAGGVFPYRTGKVAERAEPEADDRAVFGEAVHVVGGRGRVGWDQADAQEAAGIGVQAVL